MAYPLFILQNLFPHPVELQWRYQLAGLGVSLALSLGGGAVFGVVSKYFLGRCMELDPTHPFEDFEFFETDNTHGKDKWQSELNDMTPSHDA
jgi:hypothetical protein